MVEIAQAAHLDRLVQDDGPYELRQIRLVVGPSPDAHTDPDALHDLLPQNLIQFPPLQEYKEIHPAAAAFLNFRFIGQQLGLSLYLPRTAAGDMPCRPADDVAPGCLLIAGPRRFAQNPVFGIRNHRRSPEPVAGNPQNGFHALLAGRDFCHLIQ